VWFVPALLGLGTPVWDFGARGTFVGLTRGSGRPELVRAVLEGVAHRGADLLEAAESDSGLPVDSLRVDGGMSANPVFIRSLADACGRPVEIAPVLEATTLGAAYLAGMAVGTWADEDDVGAAWSPRQVVEPTVGDDERGDRRARWLEARGRSEATIPELSALDF
jgi:glycerol kinase